MDSTIAKAGRMLIAIKLPEREVATTLFSLSARSKPEPELLHNKHRWCKESTANHEPGTYEVLSNGKCKLSLRTCHNSSSKIIIIDRSIPSKSIMEWDLLHGIRVFNLHPYRGKPSLFHTPSTKYDVAILHHISCITTTMDTFLLHFCH